MHQPEQTISENQSDLFPPKQIHPQQYQNNYHEIQSELSDNFANKHDQYERKHLKMPEQQEHKDNKFKMPENSNKYQHVPRAQTRHGRHGKILIEEEQGKGSRVNNNRQIKLFNVEDQLQEKEESLIEANNLKSQDSIPIRVTPTLNPYQKTFEENNSNTFIQPIQNKQHILESQQNQMYPAPGLTVQYNNNKNSGQERLPSRRAKLIDIGTAKTGAMKKNLMQAEMDKEIQYVIPAVSSKASLQTGNLQSSRDDLSSRNMIESLSPTRKKRLPQLKPMNEILNRKQEKLYSLKTYDPIDSVGQKQKKMVVLRNGKFAILKQDIQEKRSFLYEPIGFDKCLETTITRNRGCSKFGYLDYDLVTNDGQYLLSWSNYHISLSKGQFGQNSEHFVAKVQGNFRGSIFNIYSTLCTDSKARQLEATIYYSPQWLCCKVAARHIEIYIKNKNFRYGQLEGSDDKKNLKELYQLQSNRTFRKIHKYVNKQPKWLPDKQIYALNFRGKVKYSSVKNMIIVNNDDKSQQALLLAKQGPDQFAFDIQYPFNPIVAIAFAMTSFDFKLASQ